VPAVYRKTPYPPPSAKQYGSWRYEARHYGSGARRGGPNQSSRSNQILHIRQIESQVDCRCWGKTGLRIAFNHAWPRAHIMVRARLWEGGGGIIEVHSIFIGAQSEGPSLVPTLPTQQHQTSLTAWAGQPSLRQQSLGSDYPLLFSDGDISSRLPSTTLDVTSTCHPSKSLPISWSAATKEHIINILYARLLFLFSNVICIFADNVGGLETVQAHLQTWATVGSASSLPKTIRPRVIIVITAESPSVTQDLLEKKDLRFSLSQYSPDVSQTFHSVRL
jgi:hypothetical protein